MDDYIIDHEMFAIFHKQSNNSTGIQYAFRQIFGSKHAAEIFLSGQKYKNGYEIREIEIKGERNNGSYICVGGPIHGKYLPRPECGPTYNYCAHDGIPAYSKLYQHIYILTRFGKTFAFEYISSTDVTGERPSMFQASILEPIQLPKQPQNGE